MPLLRSMKFAVLFVVLLIGGDRLLSEAILLVVDASPDRFIQIYSKSYAADVIVLGDSRADRHFPAARLSQVLDAEVMNLGIGGLSMTVSELLLSDYLDGGRVPERVVVELNSLLVRPDHIGDMHFFGLYSKRIREHTRQSEPKLYRGSQLLRLLYFNSGMFYRVLFSHIQPESDRLHSAAMSEAAVERLRQESTKTYRLRQKNLAALRRIGELSEQYGFKLELLVAPYFPVFEDRRQIRAIQSWLDQVREAMGPALPVRDYSSLLKERRYFRDSVHLNAAGVRLFVDRLIADGVFGADAAADSEVGDRWRQSF